jgi:transcription antitermination factor NusG
MVLQSPNDCAKIDAAIASHADPAVRGPATAFRGYPEFDEDAPPLNDGFTVGEMPGRWHVAACRQKHVKAYARDLFVMSRNTDGAVGYMLPMTTITSRTNRRRRYKSPLFPGLIFVRVADDSVNLDPNHRTFSQFRIIVPDSAQTRFIADLARVEQLVLTDPDHVEVWPGIREGQRVRILSGAFMGREVDVLTLDNRRRKIVVVMAFMGEAVTCDLDDDVMVEPID